MSRVHAVRPGTSDYTESAPQLVPITAGGRCRPGGLHRARQPREPAHRCSRPRGRFRSAPWQPASGPKSRLPTRRRAQRQGRLAEFEYRPQPPTQGAVQQWHDARQGETSAPQRTLTLPSRRSGVVGVEQRLDLDLQQRGSSPGRLLAGTQRLVHRRQQRPQELPSASGPATLCRPDGCYEVSPIPAGHLSWRHRQIRRPRPASGIAGKPRARPIPPLTGMSRTCSPPPGRP